MRPEVLRLEVLAVPAARVVEDAHELSPAAQIGYCSVTRSVAPGAGVLGVDVLAVLSTLLRVPHDHHEVRGHAARPARRRDRGRSGRADGGLRIDADVAVEAAAVLALVGARAVECRAGPARRTSSWSPLTHEVPPACSSESSSEFAFGASGCRRSRGRAGHRSACPARPCSCRSCCGRSRRSRRCTSPPSKRAALADVAVGLDVVDVDVVAVVGVRGLGRGPGTGRRPRRPRRPRPRCRRRPRRRPRSSRCSRRHGVRCRRHPGRPRRRCRRRSGRPGRRTPGRRRSRSLRPSSRRPSPPRSHRSPSRTRRSRRR